MTDTELCDGERRADPLNDASTPMSKSARSLSGTKTLAGPDQAAPPAVVTSRTKLTPVAVVAYDHTIPIAVDVGFVVHVARIEPLAASRMLIDS